MAERSKSHARKVQKAALQLRHGTREIGRATKTLLPILIPAAIGILAVARHIKESRETGELHIETLDKESLHTILEHAYGEKDWHETDQAYWASQKWEYQHPKNLTPDLWTADTRQTYEDLTDLLEWMWEPESIGHFDPVPGVPVFDESGNLSNHRAPNWNSPSDVFHATAELARYHFNSSSPGDLTTLLARDKRNNLRGALSIRWAGDLYVPNQKERRIACLERAITDPSFRRRGVYSTLVRSAHYKIFEEVGYEESRLWAMTDPQAGNYQENLNCFIVSNAYRVLTTESPQWSVYAKEHGMSAGGREGLLLYYRPEFGRQSK